MVVCRQSENLKTPLLCFLVSVSRIIEPHLAHMCTLGDVDCTPRQQTSSQPTRMPPRISGHDLMAIFPTNPPQHNVSCDDLFKKQARQFLSTPEPPVVMREPTTSSYSRSPAQGGVTTAYSGNRSSMDPDPRGPSQPHSQHQHPITRQSPNSSDSRPQTASSHSSRREGNAPVINQSEVRLPLLS